MKKYVIVMKILNDALVFHERFFDVFTEHVERRFEQILVWELADLFSFHKVLFVC